MKKQQIILAVITMSFFIACNQGVKNKKTKKISATEEPVAGGQASVVDKESEPNALQLAKSMDDFKTLVAAIEAAGVQDAVVNAGPLTIFAPLNTAFDKLPSGTVETLLKPENKSKLAFILTHHVAPANYPQKQLKKEAKKGRKLYMASGKYLVVEDKDDDGLYVGGIKVLKTVKVSNGWVHVIDNVLLPEEDKK